MAALLRARRGLPALQLQAGFTAGDAPSAQQPPGFSCKHPQKCPPPRSSFIQTEPGRELRYGYRAEQHQVLATGETAACTAQKHKERTGELRLSPSLAGAKGHYHAWLGQARSWRASSRERPPRLAARGTGGKRSCQQPALGKKDQARTVTWTGKEPAPGRASQRLEVVPNLPVEITHWRDHISHQPGSAPTPTLPTAPPHHFSKTQGNHKQAMSIRQAPWGMGIRCKRPSHCQAVPLITSTLLLLAVAGPHSGDESRRKAVPALLAQQRSAASSSSAPGHSCSKEPWGGRDGVRTRTSSRQRASASSLCNLVPPKAQLLVLLTEFPLSLPQVKSGKKKTRVTKQPSEAVWCKAEVSP